METHHHPLLNISLKEPFFEFFCKQGPQAQLAHTLCILFASSNVLSLPQTHHKMKIHFVLLSFKHLGLRSHLPHQPSLGYLISSFFYLEIFLSFHRRLGLFAFMSQIHFYFHYHLNFLGFKFHSLFLILFLGLSQILF